MSLNNNLPFQNNNSACSMNALMGAAKAHVEHCKSNLNIVMEKCIIGNTSFDIALMCQDNSYKDFVCGCIAPLGNKNIDNGSKKEEHKIKEPKIEKLKVKESNKKEEPKVEESRKEEPKIEKLKVEEPKKEEHKIKEPKIEKLKVKESNKKEEPKVEKSKVEEPTINEENMDDNKESTKGMDKEVVENMINNNYTYGNNGHGEEINKDYIINIKHSIILYFIIYIFILT